MIVLLLLACGSSTSLVGDPVAGEALYGSSCASCHAADGTGGSGPSLVSLVPGLTEAELTDTIQNGYGDMAPTGLADQEAADVVAYLVATWG